MYKHTWIYGLYPWYTCPKDRGIKYLLARDGKCANCGETVKEKKK